MLSDDALAELVLAESEVDLAAQHLDRCSAALDAEGVDDGGHHSAYALAQRQKADADFRHLRLVYRYARDLLSEVLRLRAQLADREAGDTPGGDQMGGGA